MKKLDHIKAKALELRYAGKTLPEIADLLGRSKGTVHYWLKGIPLQRERKDNSIALQKATEANAKKWKDRRMKAYQEGISYFNETSSS